MANETVIKTIIIRGSAEGVAQTEAQVRKLAGSMEDVTVVTEQQTKAVLSADAAFKRLQTRYDETFRAQQALAQVQKTLSNAVAQGLTTQERASQLMQEAIKFHNKTSEAQGTLANSSKLARYELLNLSRQVQDVGVSLASGQAPMRVLIQQGSQIADAFQTARASGVSLGSAILGLITPMRVAIGVFALVAGGVVFLESSLISLEKQLNEVAKQTGTSIEKLRALQAAAVPHLTFDEFITGIKQVSENVDKARIGLGSMGELFRRNGESAGSLMQDLLNVADILQRARSEQQKYQILQEAGLPATQGWVKFLSQAPDTIKKAVEQFEQANSRSSELADSAEKFSEAWTKAWDTFKRNAMETANSVFSFFVKLIDAAANLGTAIQQKILTGLRGFTPEQALRFQGQRSLTLGLGTQTIDSEGASKFYQAMRGAAGETEKIKNNAAKTNEEGRELSQREIQRVQTLGNLASIEEVANAKRIQLNELEASIGVNLGKQKETLVEIARLQEIASRSQARVGALTESATALDKYNAKVDELRVKLKDTTISQQDFNKEVLLASPAIKAVSDAIAQLGGDLAGAFIDGKDAAEALNTSLKNIAKTAASEAIRNLLKGDLAQAAVSAGIAAVSFLASKLGGGDTEAEKERQKQMEESRKATIDAAQSLKQLTDQLHKLNDAAGPVTSSIRSAQEQFKAIQQQGQVTQTAAATFAQQGGNLALAGKAWQDAANAVDQARKDLEKYNETVIETAEAALKAAPALGETSQAVANLNKQADDLHEAFLAAGSSAEDAARSVNNDLAVALDNLANKTTLELQKAINDNLGQGFINQFTDLFAKLADLQSLPQLDPKLVQQFFVTSAQAIVNSAQLTGDAFDELIKEFPQLTGLVHEFTGAVRSAADLASQAQDLSDRLFAATNDTSTLAGALAAFDRSANQQRQAEIAAGGQNIALLEETLAAERLQIINKFNDQAIAAEKQAAQDRLNQIKSIAKTINDYINSLLGGSQSALSPANRLAAAQATFQQQLTLAQGGDLEAQQNITKSAEDFRQAAQDMFGSSQQFQTIQQQIISALQGLPAVQQAADPTIAALNNVVSAVNETTAAVTDTTTAVDSSNAFLNNQTQLLASSNNIQNAANTLATDANSLASTANVFLQSMQSLLNSINTQTAVLLSSEDHLNNIQNTSNNISARANEISSHTSHMYAPGGSLQFFLAQGGFVGVPNTNSAPQFLSRAFGGSITDTVPTMLTPGEFVVRRSVAQAHASNLAALNATGNWPGGVEIQQEIRILGMQLSALLQQVVRLQAANNREVATNTQATNSQTQSLNRETRFTARKGAA